MIIMEKFKAFIISIGFAAVVSILVFILVLITEGQFSKPHHLFLSILEFLSIGIAFCLAIPAMGHILVRRETLGTGMLWWTSLVMGVLTVLGIGMLRWGMLVLFKETHALIWVEIKQDLMWSAILLPLSLLGFRFLISVYLKLLDRAGLLSYFKQEFSGNP